MIMKRRYLFLFILLVSIGLMWWLFFKRSSPAILQSLETNPPSLQQPLPSGNGLQKQLATTQAAPSSTSAVPAAGVEYFEKVKADPQYDWKQPINFYGRVVDENGTPVIGASVHFEWTDLSPTGNAEADAMSDNNGAFSLTGQHGKRLIVDVGKNGYYSSGNARGGAFEYANPFDGLFKPDINNPVVFHLRKKGVGVDLIVSQNGMSTFMRIVPPTNGSAIFLDFFNQKVGNAGQLKIEGWKEPKDFKTAQNNWGLRLTVPDGGLIENTDEFSFEAPVADYQSMMEWHFTNGSADWQGGINKKYYIKFGNPPRYGKITFDTGAFYPAVHLEYAINPDGSRNLEPK